ncbi:MAG TPA: hypothetical protein VJZ27_13555, partial [Aggregatilineales bacterium]|nr:hypothetical protein [Aggregatilineales bacterium]
MTPSDSRRTLTYFGAVIVIAAALTLFPLEWSRWLFMMMILGAGGYAISRIPGIGIRGRFAQVASWLRHYQKKAALWLAEHRRPVAYGSTVLAVGLMFISAIIFRNSDSPDSFELALMWMLPGGGALWVSLYLRDDVLPLATPANVDDDSRIRWRFIAAGTAGMLLLAEINGRWFDFLPLDGISHHFQMLLFIASLILIA